MAQTVVSGDPRQRGRAFVGKVLPTNERRRSRNDPSPSEVQTQRERLLAGFNAAALKRYVRCGLNLWTVTKSLALWFFFLCAASFALVFVQFTAGLYIPVFVPGATYAVAYAFGLFVFGGLCRENLLLVHLAGATAFVGLFAQGFELSFAGLPPFDRLFLGGPQWDGRVFTQLPASSSQSAAVFTLFWTLWLFEILFAIALCVFTLSFFFMSAGAKQRVHLFRYDYEDAGERTEVLVHPGRERAAPTNDRVQFATCLTWHPTLFIMWLKRLRVFVGFWAFVGVWVSIGLGIVSIQAHNAMVGGAAPRAYTWSRSPSPQFLLVCALGGDLVDLVPHPVFLNSDPGKRKEPSFGSALRTRFMGGRSDWYLVLLLLHYFGIVQSIFWVSADYGARIFGNSQTYARQLNINFGLTPGWSNCLYQTQCYAYANPFSDGDAAYVLNKSTVYAPQDFATETQNQVTVELWILVCGCLCTVLLTWEYWLGRCTSLWSVGLHAVDPTSALPNPIWVHRSKLACVKACDRLAVTGEDTDTSVRQALLLAENGRGETEEEEVKAPRGDGEEKETEDDG
jgi:hypothetical protein